MTTSLYALLQGLKRRVSLVLTSTIISSSSNCNNNDSLSSPTKEIHKVWSNSRYTYVISIPKKICEKYGIKPKCYIVITDTPDGILVRKSRD
jgi:hypothetical protein